MKKWEADIPKTPSRKNRKRCYRCYRKVGLSGRFMAGGKVVWMTNKEMTLAIIKYPNMIFEEVLEKDSLEELKKYMDQKIED